MPRVCDTVTCKFTAWKSIPRLKSDWCIFHGKLSCTSSLQLKLFHVSLFLGTAILRVIFIELCRRVRVRVRVRVKFPKS